MIQCDGDRKCTYIGFDRQCLSATSYVCEHKKTVPDSESRPFFRGNQGQTLYNSEQPIFNRIADALERIATALEDANKRPY